MKKLLISLLILVNNVITLNVSSGTYYLTITKNGQSRTYTVIK